MKLCRFQPLLFSAEQISSGRAPGEGVRPEPRAGVITGETLREIAGAIFGQWRATERAWLLAETKLLPPLTPGKIVCLGRNYR